jgi:hypothetical protein
MGASNSKDADSVAWSCIARPEGDAEVADFGDLRDEVKQLRLELNSLRTIPRSRADSEVPAAAPVDLSQLSAPATPLTTVSDSTFAVDDVVAPSTVSTAPSTPRDAYQAKKLSATVFSPCPAEIGLGPAKATAAGKGKASLFWKHAEEIRRAAREREGMVVEDCRAFCVRLVDEQ